SFFPDSLACPVFASSARPFAGSGRSFAASACLLHGLLSHLLRSLLSHLLRNSLRHGNHPCRIEPWNLHFRFFGLPFCVGAGCVVVTGPGCAGGGGEGCTPRIGTPWNQSETLFLMITSGHVGSLNTMGSLNSILSSKMSVRAYG